MNQEIPVPITFNPHKHHLGFLMKQIPEWRNREWPDVKEELQCIGNNLVDFYLGRLSVEAICAECLVFFYQRELTSPGKFSDWLEPHEYRKIRLSDDSRWVIKRGIDPERYIHIHPAKNSPLSIRVRATTLKTVVALIIHNRQPGEEHLADLQAVNTVRSAFLGLSPVKSLTRNKGIARLWALFQDQITSFADPRRTNQH